MEENKAFDLGAALSETMDNLAAAEAPAEDNETPAEATEEIAEEEAITDGGDAEEVTDEAEEADETEEESEGSDTGGENESQETDALEPLDKWSDEDKAAFKSLPRPQQEYVLKRERDVEGYLTKRTQELSERYKPYESLAPVLEARRQQAQMAGMTVDNLINQLFAYSDYANSDPRGFILQMAQARGIDLNELATGDIGESYIDPEVAQLKQQVNQLTQSQLQAQQRQLESVNNQMLTIAESFASDSNNKYFEQVQDDIVPMLNIVKAQNPTATPQEWLKEAYDRCCYANPTVRKQVLEDQRKAELAASHKEAQKAKKAKGTIAKTKGESAGKAKPVSIEDTLSRLVDERAMFN